MNQIQLITILILVSILSLGNCVRSKNKTSLVCHKGVLNDIDKHLRIVEMIHGDARFPTKFEDLKKHCANNKKVIELMTKLADDCMTGFTKNIMQVTVYSIKRARKSLCRNKPNKEILSVLDAGKCVNSMRKEFSQCLNRTQIHLESVKTLQSKKRLPFICCEIIRAKSCMLDQAKDVDTCTEQHIETLQKQFTHVSANALNMACGEYNEDSNRCDSFKPPKGLNYNKPPKSFMKTALDLLELFENDPDLQVP